MRNVRAQQKLERAWIKHQEEERRKQAEKRAKEQHEKTTNQSATERT